MAHHMLKAIPATAVKCNEPVEKIVWENNAGKDVLIRTSSGQEYKCNHVIVTCSIGFLKEHWTDFFQPNLPSERLALYDRIGYGSITKVCSIIYLQYYFYSGILQIAIGLLDYDDVR